ncbi:MAG: CAP domain-containing protein [Microgenomates group bacterium]
MEHFLRHFFVPHVSNNHHAKALHLDSMLCYVLIFAIFNFGIRIMHREFPNVLGYATDIRVDQLLSGTNAKRQALGLSPLTYNVTLSQAAALKAQDMFQNDYWSHNSPEGKTPWTFIQQAGYTYTVAGENLAKNFSTSQGVIDAWMASPTHKDNIIKPSYQDIGFAIVNGVLNGEETTLVVQMFGAGSGQLAAEKPVQTVVTEKAAVVEVYSEQTQLGEQTTKEVEEQVVPPVEIKPVAAVKPTPVLNVLSTMFSSVTKKPMINIPTVTRDVAFLFMGLLIGILIIDGIVVSKKKITRVAGHNLAHILFFTAFFIALTIVRRGVLL